MRHSDNLLYYSTNSKLAFYLAENFFNDIHFVWCSPVFNPETLGEMHKWKHIPDSSSPKHIYEILKRDTEKNDNHSSKIKENKEGLKKAASIKLIEGVITGEDYLRIIEIIDTAKFSEFSPVLYLIPVTKEIKDKIEEASVSETASPLSTEYKIKNLKGSEFEKIIY